MAAAARQSFLQLLGDVTLSSPSNGQALVFNGTTWVNGSAGVSDHGALTGLADDDHTQYHNDSRALTWLGTRSTADLPEGANLYHTVERVQDVIGALLVDSATLDVTYNDAGNAFTMGVIQSGLDHGSIGGLIDDDHSQYIINLPGTNRNLITPPDSTYPALQLERSSTVSGGTITTDNLLTIGPNGLTSNWLGVKADGKVVVNKAVGSAAGSQLDITPDSTTTVAQSIDLPASYSNGQVLWRVRDSSNNVRLSFAINLASSFVDLTAYGTTHFRMSSGGVGVQSPLTMSHVFTAGTSFSTSSTGFVVKGPSGQTVPIAYMGRDNNTAGAYILGFRSKTSTTSDVVCAILDADWGVTTHASRAGRLTLSVVDASATREALRLDTDGSGANISLFGAGSYGAGRNVVFLPNAGAVPSSNPTGGGILYCEAGALKFRGSGGTVTTIAAA